MDPYPCTLYTIRVAGSVFPTSFFTHRHGICMCMHATLCKLCKQRTVWTVQSACSEHRIGCRGNRLSPPHTARSSLGQMADEKKGWGNREKGGGLDFEGTRIFWGGRSVCLVALLPSRRYLFHPSLHASMAIYVLVSHILICILGSPYARYHSVYTRSLSIQSIYSQYSTVNFDHPPGNTCTYILLGSRGILWVLSQ